MLTPVGRQSLTQVRYSSGKLKELGIRLKSIRNIEKITKTMKMISSAKFAKVSFICCFWVTYWKFEFFNTALKFPDFFL